MDDGVKRGGRMNRYGLRTSALVGLVLIIGGCADMPSMTPDVVGELPEEIRFRTYSSAATTPTILVTAPLKFAEMQMTGPLTPIDISWESNVTADITGGTYKIAVYDKGVFQFDDQNTSPLTVQLTYGDHHITLELQHDDGTPVDSPTARVGHRIRVTKQ